MGSSGFSSRKSLLRSVQQSVDNLGNPYGSRELPKLIIIQYMQCALANASLRLLARPPQQLPCKIVLSTQQVHKAPCKPTRGLKYSLPWWLSAAAY